MNKLFLIILIAAFGLAGVVEVFAATGVPKILNYQGRLLDASGILLGESGTEFCFKFSFYDDAAVGVPDNKLWPAGSPSTMTVLVKNGIFDVGIGDTLKGGDILDFDFQTQDEIYVNTEVAQKVGVTCAPGDGAEVFENLSPRQRVVSSGYSINSDTLDGFHAAPSATGNQIPVLTSGNLFLGSLTPQINATSSNSLTIQGNALGGNLLLNPLSGFVGIGTTSPSQLLSVQGNAFFSGRGHFGGILTATSSVFLAVDGGRVGIGTSAPQEKLHLANGNFLQDNPASPAVIGGANLVLPGGGAQWIYVSGKYAYLIFNNAAGTDILRIVDITEPANPVIVGGVSLSLPGSPRSIYVNGRYAYILFRNTVETDGLRIVDISEPANPVAVGGSSLSLPVNGQHIFVSGRYAYATFDNAAGTNTFRIIDISNPANPAVAGGTNLNLPTSPRQIYVSGKYAYLVFYNTVSTDALRIVDVSNPVNPSIAGGSALSLGFSAWSIYVSGRYAYIGLDNVAGTNSFRVVDISNPVAPAVTGGTGLNLPGFVKSVFVSGRYAYLVFDNAAGTDVFRIIDIGNPANPLAVGGTALFLPGFPKSVFVNGRYAYIDFFQGAGTDVFRIVDISGIEAVSASLHSLEAGNIQVKNDLTALGQIQAAGGLSVGNGGIYTSGSITAGGGLASGTIFQISGYGSTSSLFSITQGIIGNLDFSRITVGGLAKEDQFYVFGRINSSWRVYQKELMATCTPLSNILVDTADICGLIFDEDTDGGILAKVVNSSAIRLRANTSGTGAASAGDGAILGSGGSLAMTGENNPVMEARVRPVTLTNHKLEAGFTGRLFNGNITTDPTDGVFFRATPASPNWIAVNRSSDVETGSTVDTGIAVSTTNFQELRIEVSGSINTRFFIDGALVATIIANIPTVNLGFSVGNAIATTADGPKDFDIESIKVWVDDPPAGMGGGEMATTTDSSQPSDSEIQTVEAADSGLGDMISRIMASFGLLIENGIAKFQEFIAEKAVIKEAEIKNLTISGKMQMRDQATDEIYCAWLENGEWKKVLGFCENLTSTSTAADTGINQENSTTIDFVINQENATTTENFN